MEIKKKCTACSIDQPLDNFFNCKRSIDKKQSHCKSCKSKQISEYYSKNPHKKFKRSQEANRIKSLKQYYKDRVSANFARSMRAIIKANKGGVSWKKLVDYTPQELKQHIQSLFLPGMTWENYGLWHIDHKKPICQFTITSLYDEQFKACWSLDNLQPLWAKDNQKKGGRV